MRDLNYDLKQLCRHNRDGSYATQADREHILDLIADQLHEMGFRHMDAHSLKPKHIEKLVERWLAEELSPGTIKNRMSALRWWAEKIGKENIIARTNAAYGIPDRVYVTNISKAKELAMDQLANIRTLCIRISLRLQGAFGLRREDRQGKHHRSHQFCLRHSRSCLCDQHFQSQGAPHGSARTNPHRSSRYACRRHSACGGKSRSRSRRSGRIEVIRSYSRIRGPRAGGSARFPSAPRSSGNSSMRRRRSPRARA